MSWRSLSHVACLLLAGLLVLASVSGAVAASQVLPYGKLPLRFEPNEGQSDPLVKFLARGRGHALFLTATDAVLVFNPPPQSSRERGRGVRDLDTAPSVVTMRLVGARPTPAPTAVDRLPGASHYLIGRDRTRWRRNVAAYARIRYDEVYPGVSLVYYGNQGRLEYDFVVAPGADPAAIALEFDGASGLRVDERGDLMIGIAGGEARLQRPLVYQEVDGRRRHVAGGYTVEDGRRVRFQIGSWEPGRPLVIDPVLVYSTYLGGGGDDEAFGIAVDLHGRAYVTGSTISADFPIAGGVQPAKSGVTDAFVTKLDASGSNIVYSTYLGGNGDDAGNAIAVDDLGNAYVAGQTASTNFPLLDPFQTSRRGLDGFLSKLDPTGGNLVYSTLLGGSQDDVVLGVAVDGSGGAVVTGATSSTDFPTANALQPALRAGSDAFVTRFTATGARLVYSTFLGGSGDDIGSGVAVDASGDAYVVGTTASTNFPVVRAVQSVKAAGLDAFVARLDATGAFLVFSTYLGGNSDDEGNAIAVARDGSAVTVVGDTRSTNFPTAVAIQPANGGTTDAFVTRLDGAGVALLFSTYLGGTGVDVAHGVAVHTDGTTSVVGTTRSINFPVFNALVGGGALAGGTDVFLTKLTPPGLELGYSTYLGGAGDDTGNAIALDADGLAYIAGSTDSTGFPVVEPAQRSLGGGLDAFVAQVADGGIVQFSAPTFTVRESAGTVTVVVTRTGDHSDAATVRYATSDGTALAGADYRSAAGTLSFAPGETARTFTVPIIGDTDGEGDETFVVTLSAPTGGAVLGTRSTASVKILDDEASVNFDADGYTVTEGSGAVITVVRSGPAPLAGTVVVGYATENGSATGGAAAGPGVDYITSTGTLTFGPGITTRTFTVPTVNDTLAESTETVRLRLTSVSGGTPPARLGVRATATLDITDNDAGGILQFSAPTYSVGEGTPAATIVVTRSGGAASNVTVDFATSDDTARAGVNYVATSGTLTFNAGTTSRSFTVPIIDNAAAQGNVRLNLTLSNATGGAQLGSRAAATLTVIDDEPNLSFTTSAFTVSEASTTATITVRRGGVATSTVRADYTTSDLTARAGVDYRATAGTLTFGPGVLSQSFKVEILNNRLADGPRTLQLALANPQGGAAVAAPSVATLQVVDDDRAGAIQFSASSYTVSETAGTATITVTRTGGLADNVVASYRTSGGRPGIDYTATSGTLTFLAGETAKTFTVTILNNGTGDDPALKTVTLDVSPVTPGATAGVPGQATLRILDDEPTVQFGSAGFVVAEAGGSATITVKRNGPLTGTVTVQYATSNGTATGGAVTGPGIDYLARAGTLTFGPGVAARTFTVPIVNDTVVEGDETIVLTLSNAVAVGGGVPTIVGTNPATLAILDDDRGGVIEFDSATYTVLENAGFARIKVKRTGGLASGVTVQYATDDGVGTALAGADYTPASNTLTFAAGELTKTFTIPIVNDTLDEANETVALVLSSPGGGGSLGARDSATLTIVDDDTAGVVQFSAPVYTVSEAATQAVITVKRTGGIATGTGAPGISVDYATSDGTATAGSDYTASAGTLDFAAGQLTATFTVPLPPDDPIKEGNETVLLALSNPRGGVTLGPQNTAVLKIVDNESSTVQLSASAYTVTEGVAAVITVERTGTAGLPGTVTVQYAAAAGGPTPATPATDFTPVAGTLTFGPGVATRTFSVPTTTNGVPSGPRTIVLTLSNPQPSATAILAPRSTAVLSIVDNDPGGQIQWSSASYQAREGAGLMYLIARRTGGFAGGVTVPYTVVDGSAVAGQHFTLASGTLRFAAGATQVNVPAYITPQNTVETGPLTFTVVMGTPQPAGFATSATLGSPSTATVTIVDDDEGGVVQFGVPSVRVAENAAQCTPAPPANACARVTVSRTGGAASAVTADYSMSDGTAVANVHYVQTSGQVSFAAGQASATIPVELIDDGTNNGLRTFTITLGNARGGATIGASSSLEVQVVDND